jgi:CHAT domain-containing protein
MVFFILTGVEKGVEFNKTFHSSSLIYFLFLNSSMSKYSLFIVVFLGFWNPLLSQELDTVIVQLIFKGDFVKAKEKLDKQLNLNSQKDKATAYRIKGDIAKAEGDIETALLNWKKAAELQRKLYPDNQNYHHAWEYAHLSNYHYEKTNRNFASVYADSCIRLLKNVSFEEKKEIEIFKILNIIAQSKKQQADGNDPIRYMQTYNECLSLYQKSITFLLTIDAPEHYLANTYHLMGNAHHDMLYYYKDSPDKITFHKNVAFKYYDKALVIWRKLYGNTHYSLATTLFVKGLLFEYLPNSDPTNKTVALDYFRQSIVAFGLNLKSKDEVTLKQIPNKATLLMSLTYFTNNLLYSHPEDITKSTYLKEAQYVNALAIEVWKSIHESFDSDNTNQNLAIYGLIPQEAQIAILMRQEQVDETKLKEQFFQANQKLKYFDLFKQKAGLNGKVQISEIQSELKSGQLFLDFHFSYLNESIYILQITKNESKLVTVPYRLDATIGEFNRAIIERDYDRYIEVAHTFFVDLFPNGLGNTTELIICPTRLFTTVPFEALLCSLDNTNTKDYRKLDYLVHHVAIQYVLTASSFTNHSKIIAWDVAVFTPNCSDKFAELPFSTQFGKAMSEELKTKKYTGIEASKTTLLNSKSSILHLSTHAIIDDEVTANYMQMYDEKLLQHEFVQMKHTPDLMVINSCNSGKGKLILGDGVNGIVRELHRLGVGSTISNLWEVDDKASNVLLFEFYRNLSNGTNSNKALRLAKIDQIKNAPNSELGAPYYWAGHKLVGRSIDCEVADSQNGFLSKYWFFVILALVISILVIRKVYTFSN